MSEIDEANLQFLNIGEFNPQQKSFEASLKTPLTFSLGEACPETDGDKG